MIAAKRRHGYPDGLEAREFEEIVRRVVRQELSAHDARSGGIAPARGAPQAFESRRGASGANTELMSRVLAYLERIDPDGQLSREAATHALHAQFPELR